jgi:hypothetical protein
MKKIFISQRVSGMDREKLKEETEKIAGVLEKKGYGVDYVIDYPIQFTNASIKDRLANYAFKRMDKSNLILAIIRGKDKSEGMLMEIGHILDKKDKEIVLAIDRKVNNTYMRTIADKTIEYNTFEDLLTKLNGMDI